jgi:hypothetical protein
MRIPNRAPFLAFCFTLDFAGLQEFAMRLAYSFVALSLAAGTEICHGADSPLQARTWDVETVIPAGGYRSQKSIDLLGDWSPKVERGAVIDDIGFHGRGGVQHWKVDGAILNNVRISGKRGMSLRATDTVLENCEFWKDDNWFDFWWSTKWRFDNCIFTKKFVRGDLPPLDYSARATGCTLYNVKLPWVGMKENPAGYLQKNDMGFVKCRFVQCDVPETFLAGTVDCVFEGCQFQAKRHAWPKETTPIKVTAYYSGMGAAPKSFINGPLTVEFLPAPKDLQFGSNLAHSISGGRILLTTLRLPQQYTMIGTTQKKASEIPGAGIPSKPAADVPPVAPDSPPPSGPAARPDFFSIDELLRPIPAGIELTKSGQFHVPGVSAANQWLSQNAIGKTGAVRLMVEGMQAIKEEGHTFKITGREQIVTIRGTNVSARIVALFQPDQASALTGVTKNRDLPVRGIVQKAAIEGQRRMLSLTITLSESRTP